MARLLVIEDEVPIAAGLQEALQNEGFEVDVQRDGQSGLEAIRRESYDCVLLDVMLPLMNGRDVCRTLRAEGNQVLILMLTSKTEEADIVLGLEIGADDYMTKPFRLAELVARIRALIRRRAQLHAEHHNVLQLGDVRVDFSAMVIERAGQPLHMSVREFEVLKLLAQHRGSIVSRDMLLDQVWGYDAFPTTRTVDNYILSLRKKIEPHPTEPRYITTVHGAGYRLSIEEG